MGYAAQSLGMQATMAIILRKFRCRDQKYFLVMFEHCFAEKDNLCSKAKVPAAYIVNAMDG